MSPIYKLRTLMSKIIIKQSQFNRLIETGSNSAAMDLDIYVQPVIHDTNNGNQNVKDTIKETVKLLEEILYMIESGKKISSDNKNNLYQILDQIKLFFNNSTSID